MLKIAQIIKKCKKNFLEKFSRTFNRRTVEVQAHCKENEGKNRVIQIFLSDSIWYI